MGELALVSPISARCIPHAPLSAARLWFAAVASTEAPRDKPLPISAFKVGDVIEGVVIKKIKSGVVLDVGAERAAILDAGEIRDGFPTEGMPHKNKNLSVRVLNVDDGELRVTMRSGSLS